MPVYKDEHNSTWYVSARYVNWAGKHDRKVKRGFKKQGDAKAWERQFLFQESKSCDMTLSSMVDLYLADMSSRIKVSTMNTKMNIINTHILPYFQNTKINGIDPAAIRHWQAELMSEKTKSGELKYSQTFLHTVNSQFSAIMNYAVRYYNLGRNPFTVTGSMGKKKAGEMSIWTVDDFNKAIANEDNLAKKIAFDILFWGGLRIGECLSLCPQDIQGDSIVVTKTYSKGEDTTSPKTENSVRKVPMPGFVIDELRDYIKKLYGLQSEDRIFYFGKSILNKELHRLADISGLPRIRIHDLRHSHASLLIKLGFSMPAVAKRLGDTVAVVMDTYAHLYPDDQAMMVSRLAEVKDGINSSIFAEKKPDIALKAKSGFQKGL